MRVRAWCCLAVALSFPVQVFQRCRRYKSGVLAQTFQKDQEHETGRFSHVLTRTPQGSFRTLVFEKLLSVELG